jgi:uncharacterized protein
MLLCAPKSSILESMEYISRKIEKNINAALQRNKSILLLGARQTGKTTLLQQIPTDLYVSLAQPVVRQRYERDLSLLQGEIEALTKKNSSDKDELPLVIIDEVQKIPDIMDLAQDLIDRKKAKFILTGSSARKLRRRGSINLLPGRVVSLKLTPMIVEEIPASDRIISELLLYGSLPGIVTDSANDNKDIDLNSYVTTYLEEEIRAEALVRDLGSFARFLELAASESGNIINFRKLSQEIGVAHTTISEYYQILEDCLVAERVEPLLYTKTRRRLTKMPKYLFFDLGVRRASANEGVKLPNKYLGSLFEQFIGLELLRLTNLSSKRAKVFFWRDVNGNEIDWIIEAEDKYIPLEVKLTASPKLHDAKHLQTFLDEYEQAENAYIVCTSPRKIKLAERIYAIPWQTLADQLSIV